VISQTIPDTHLATPLATPRLFTITHAAQWTEQP
jgi:hypothetical protein